MAPRKTQGALTRVANSEWHSHYWNTAGTVRLNARPGRESSVLFCHAAKGPGT
jgi:hypothetical protein